ncbi:protein of unknown function [Magnetospirillum gryphiswaldense MSR-1 v2]|uniref:Uncharacterized protein n=1 Tax=Magnetospirillum gryphiswaldense (strain DSM 6361 / JCM 21280 / NBRC 15271 / MSR-1) TaxID=431944 RepID=V6F2K5_MAGGM|nr:protein of unknown function [Magnetospirillum gryphiswaldense MSR-1 v2]
MRSPGCRTPRRSLRRQRQETKMGPEKEVPSPEAESARDAKMPEPTFLTRPPQKKPRGKTRPSSSNPNSTAS